MPTPTFYLSALTYTSLVLILPHAVRCALLTNVSIDDTNGAVVDGVLSQIAYLPTNMWKEGQNCSDQCVSGVDIYNQAIYNGTWHEVVANTEGNSTATATVSFQGSAVYVQIILPNSVHAKAFNVSTDYYFYLDSVHVGSYTKPPPSSVNEADGYDYAFIGYSNTSIPDGQHELKIQVGSTGGPPSMLLLDSVIYSTSSSSTAGSSKSSTLLSAVGSVFGVLLLLAFCGGLCRKRRTTVIPSTVVTVSVY